MMEEDAYKQEIIKRFEVVDKTTQMDFSEKPFKDLVDEELHRKGWM